MAIALVAHGQNHATDNPSVTGLNMTGASLLVMIAVRNTAGPAFALSDSSSNSYTHSTSYVHTSSGLTVRLSYAWNPAVTSSMTFNNTGTGIYSTIMVLGFSGVQTTSTPVLLSTGVNDLSSSVGTTFVLGSMATLAAGDLLITGVGNFPDQPTVWSGVTSPGGVIVDSWAGVAASTFGLAASYTINTGSALTSLTPGWTYASGSANMAGLAVTFKASGVSAGVDLGDLNSEIATYLGYTSGSDLTTLVSAWLKTNATGDATADFQRLIDLAS